MRESGIIAARPKNTLNPVLPGAQELPRARRIEDRAPAARAS
jgi:hypothetical protein